MPRLNGADIGREMPRLLALVREGIAGFIVFGGELGEVREGILELQSAAPVPLIIGSDLEQGLGQQLRGGTVFPPAMAVARAGKLEPGLMDAAFEQMADEAAYAGINTVFAPVLDINTNPRNPIICTRAFGEDAETVSDAALRMIRAFGSRGIAACGKHFPGHGDTETDSHIGLPVINKTLEDLESAELVPFRRATGVPMLMLAHLSVPALDPEGTPVSLSRRAVGYLRDKMGYRGMLITDAMNMGGIGGYSQADASLMALRAGVDILLHPDDPERLIKELSPHDPEFDARRLDAFRSSIRLAGPVAAPSFDPALSRRITGLAIRLEGTPGRMARPHLVIFNDSGEPEKGAAFAAALGETLGGLEVTRYSGDGTLSVPPDADVIAAIFSPVRAWKGGESGWIGRELSALGLMIRAVVSFGSPYILSDAPEGAARLCAYWDSDEAQSAAARRLIGR